MAASDVIRVSSETLEDIQSGLRTLKGKLGTEVGAVQALAGRIDQASGAKVPVSIKLPGQSASGDVQSALEACIRALCLCTDESVRIGGAVGKVNALFANNETELVQRFSGEETGMTDKEAQAGKQNAAAPAAEGTVLDWIRDNVPELARLIDALLSLGGDGAKIVEFFWKALKMTFGEALPADALAFFSQSAGDVFNSSLGNALTKLNAFDAISFVVKVTSGLIADIDRGLPTDRIICNTIANTMIAIISTVGSAVGGDALAKALGTAVAAIPIPGMQVVGPMVATVTSPLIQYALSRGIDAFMNLQIGDKSMTQYIQDYVYDSYKGLVEGVEVAMEVFSTIGDYAQTGAEMVREGLQNAGEAFAEGVDAMRDVAEDGIKAAQDFFSDGADFVRESMSCLVA